MSKAHDTHLIAPPEAGGAGLEEPPHPAATATSPFLPGAATAPAASVAPTLTASEAWEEDEEEDAFYDDDAVWPDATVTVNARDNTQRRPGKYSQARRLAGETPRPLPPAEAAARRRSRAAMISELYRHVRAVGRYEEGGADFLGVAVAAMPA